MGAFLRVLLALCFFLLSATAFAEGGEEVRYTIKRGDTLTKIAKKFDTTVPMLVSLNKIANPDYIRADDSLRLPEVEAVVQASQGKAKDVMSVVARAEVKGKKVESVRTVSASDLLRFGTTAKLKTSHSVSKPAGLVGRPVLEKVDVRFRIVVHGRRESVAHRVPILENPLQHLFFCPQADSPRAHLARAQIRELVKEIVPPPFDGRMLEEALLHRFQYPLLL